MDLAGARSWLIFQKLNLDKLDCMLVNSDKHRAYVEFSKDESPIHVSEDFANKVGFRGLVVHGTHLLEIALVNFFEKQPKANISYLKVDFIHAICLSEEFLVEMSLGFESGDIWITVEKSRRAKIRILYSLDTSLSSGIDQEKSAQF